MVFSHRIGAGHTRSDQSWLELAEACDGAGWSWLELAGARDGTAFGNVRSIDADSAIFAFPDAFDNNTSIDGDSLSLQSVHVLMF